METLIDDKYKNINFIVVKHSWYKIPYYCGYVEIQKDNKNKDFSNIKCYGGITYIGKRVDTGKGNYIGFDTLHGYGMKEYNNLEYAIKECKYIIDQLLDINNK